MSHIHIYLLEGTGPLQIVTVAGYQLYAVRAGIIQLAKHLGAAPIIAVPRRMANVGWWEETVAGQRLVI